MKSCLLYNLFSLNALLFAGTSAQTQNNGTPSAATSTATSTVAFLARPTASIVTLTGPINCRLQILHNSILNASAFAFGNASTADASTISALRYTYKVLPQDAAWPADDV